MAEALARNRLGDAARFESAGLYPQSAEDARAALRTLRSEFGIDVAEHKPRSVNALDMAAYTYVVAMDEEVAQCLREITERQLIVWRIDDPWDGDLATYRKSALDILSNLPLLPLAIRSGSKNNG
jgi:protein-tyrosine-phosphatase